MTNNELDAIEARVKAAKDGPWAMVPMHGGSGVAYVIDNHTGDKIASVDLFPNDVTHATASFIAHSRMDMLMLIDEAKRLRAILREK